MGHILQYYQQKAIPKAARVFASQASFGAALLDKIDVVKKCSDAVDAEAALCGIELGKETNQVAKKTKQVAEGIYEKTGNIEDSVGSLRQAISEESTLREQTAKEQEQKAMKLEEQIREVKLILQQKCDALNMVAEYLLANPRLNEVFSLGKGSLYSQQPLKEIVS
jgi:hypothetical protein